jgi:hypothetical protein
MINLLKKIFHFGEKCLHVVWILIKFSDDMTNFPCTFLLCFRLVNRCAFYPLNLSDKEITITSHLSENLLEFEIRNLINKSALKFMFFMFFVCMTSWALVIIILEVYTVFIGASNIHSVIFNTYRQKSISAPNRSKTYTSQYNRAFRFLSKLKIHFYLKML